MKPNPLVGVALDARTWLWLRRNHPGYVAKRLATGYRIIGYSERKEERTEVDECEKNTFLIES